MYIHTSLVCSTLRVSSIRIFILINPTIQHGVRIEAVATSLNKENLQMESSSFLHISKHPEHFYSRITVLLVISKKGGRQRAVQSAIVSRIFRAVLPGRIFILSGSKALQLPVLHPVQFPVQFPCLAALHQHSTRQKLHSMRPEVTSSSLWCSRVAVEEEF